MDTRARAHVCLMSATGVVTDAEVVRLREVSQTGASLLRGAKVRVGQEFLLRLGAREGHPYWLWCRARRCSPLDDLCNLVGLVWVRILFPGQDISVGSNARSLLWQECEGRDAAEDPFEADGPSESSAAWQAPEGRSAP